MTTDWRYENPSFNGTYPSVNVSLPSTVYPTTPNHSTHRNVSTPDSRIGSLVGNGSYSGMGGHTPEALLYTPTTLPSRGFQDLLTPAAQRPLHHEIDVARGTNSTGNWMRYALGSDGINGATLTSSTAAAMNRLVISTDDFTLPPVSVSYPSSGSGHFPSSSQYDLRTPATDLSGSKEDYGGRVAALRALYGEANSGSAVNPSIAASELYFGPPSVSLPTGAPLSANTHWTTPMLPGGATSVGHISTPSSVTNSNPVVQFCGTTPHYTTIVSTPNIVSSAEFTHPQPKLSASATQELALAQSSLAAEWQRLRREEDSLDASYNSERADLISQWERLEAVRQIASTLEVESDALQREHLAELTAPLAVAPSIAEAFVPSASVSQKREEIATATSTILAKSVPAGLSISTSRSELLPTRRSVAEILHLQDAFRERLKYLDTYIIGERSQLEQLATSLRHGSDSRLTNVDEAMALRNQLVASTKRINELSNEADGVREQICRLNDELESTTIGITTTSPLSTLTQHTNQLFSPQQLKSQKPISTVHNPASDPKSILSVSLSAFAALGKAPLPSDLVISDDDWLNVAVSGTTALPVSLVNVLTARDLVRYDYPALTVAASAAQAPTLSLDEVLSGGLCFKDESHNTRTNSLRADGWHQELYTVTGIERLNGEKAIALLERRSRMLLAVLVVEGALVRAVVAALKRLTRLRAAIIALENRRLRVELSLFQAATLKPLAVAPDERLPTESSSMQHSGSWQSLVATPAKHTASMEAAAVAAAAFLNRGDLNTPHGRRRSSSRTDAESFSGIGVSTPVSNNVGGSSRSSHRSYSNTVGSPIATSPAPLSGGLASRGRKSSSMASPNTLAHTPARVFSPSHSPYRPHQFNDEPQTMADAYAQILAAAAAESTDDSSVAPIPKLTEITNSGRENAPPSISEDSVDKEALRRLLSSVREELRGPAAAAAAAALLPASHLPAGSELVSEEAALLRAISHYLRHHAATSTINSASSPNDNSSTIQHSSENTAMSPLLELLAAAPAPPVSVVSSAATLPVVPVAAPTNSSALTIQKLSPSSASLSRISSSTLLSPSFRKGVENLPKGRGRQVLESTDSNTPYKNNYTGHGHRIQIRSPNKKSLRDSSSTSLVQSDQHLALSEEKNTLLPAVQSAVSISTVEESNLDTSVTDSAVVVPSTMQMSEGQHGLRTGELEEAETSLLSISGRITELADSLESRRDDVSENTPSTDGTVSVISNTAITVATAAAMAATAAITGQSWGISPNNMTPVPSSGASNSRREDSSELREVARLLVAQQAELRGIISLVTGGIVEETASRAAIAAASAATEAIQNSPRISNWTGSSYTTINTTASIAPHVPESPPILYSDSTIHVQSGRKEYDIVSSQTVPTSPVISKQPSHLVTESSPFERDIFATSVLLGIQSDTEPTSSSDSILASIEPQIATELESSLNVIHDEAALAAANFGGSARLLAAWRVLIGFLEQKAKVSISKPVATTKISNLSRGKSQSSSSINVAYLELIAVQARHLPVMKQMYKRTDAYTEFALLLVTPSTTNTEYVDPHRAMELFNHLTDISHDVLSGRCELLWDTPSETLSGRFGLNVSIISFYCTGVANNSVYPEWQEGYLTTLSNNSGEESHSQDGGATESRLVSQLGNLFLFANLRDAAGTSSFRQAPKRRDEIIGRTIIPLASIGTTRLLNTGDLPHVQNNITQYFPLQPPHSVHWRRGRRPLPSNAALRIGFRLKCGDVSDREAIVSSEVRSILNGLNLAVRSDVDDDYGRTVSAGERVLRIPIELRQRVTRFIRSLFSGTAGNPSSGVKMTSTSASEITSTGLQPSLTNAELARRSVEKIPRSASGIGRPMGLWELEQAERADSFRLRSYRNGGTGSKRAPSPQYQKSFF